MRGPSRLAAQNDKAATATTSSTLTAFMQRKSSGHSRRKHGLHSTWCLTTRFSFPSGPVRLGSVEPKTATTGTPSRVARCIVPVSLVNSSRHFRSSSISCSRVVLPMRLMQFVAQLPRRSARPPPRPWPCRKEPNRPPIAAAVAAKRSGNQRFAGPYSAPGQSPILRSAGPVGGGAASAISSTPASTPNDRARSR